MITFVQANGATGKSGSPSFTHVITNPLTAGNTVFVELGFSNNGVVATTIVDNLGNTFTLLLRSLGPSGVDLWWCVGVVGGASTLTVTFSSGKSGVGIAAIEYANTVGQTFAYDQYNRAGTFGAMSYPAGAITTTVAAELILYAGRINQQVTVPTGYTTRFNAVGSNSVSVFDRIVSATETTNPTPTGPLNSNYEAHIISFYEIPDASVVQETQHHRKVLQSETTVPVQLTQFHRKILYPFTCGGPPPPTPPAAGCPPVFGPSEVVPEPGCPPEFGTDPLE